MYIIIWFFFFQDRFADAKAIPPLDEQQDYELTGFQESGGKTLLKFKRKFDTCDPRDRKLEVIKSVYKVENFLSWLKKCKSLVIGFDGKR